MKNRPEMKNYSFSVDGIEEDQMIVNREYQDIFTRMGFDSFKSVWQYPHGKIVKKIKDRSVTRIEVNVDGDKKYFYLKKHHAKHLGVRRLLAYLFKKQMLSQGRKEFNTICDFRKHNIATVVPVAAGDRFLRFFWEESFLITESFAPFVSLENMLKHQPEFQKRIENPSTKKRLLIEAARFARKMHRTGFNHCDFNADHILIHYENGTDTPTIAIYDLQRVLRKKYFKFRWIIKSLSELGFSLPSEYFNEEDKIQLFLSYKGKSRLSFWDRLQLLWIRKKTDRIRRHTEKHPYRPPENAELNE
jgi:hypothetical protein